MSDANTQDPTRILRLAFSCGRGGVRWRPTDGDTIIDAKGRIIVQQVIVPAEGFLTWVAERKITHIIDPDHDRRQALTIAEWVDWRAHVYTAESSTVPARVSGSGAK